MYDHTVYKLIFILKKTLYSYNPPPTMSWTKGVPCCNAELCLHFLRREISLTLFLVKTIRDFFPVQPFMSRPSSLLTSFLVDLHSKCLDLRYLALHTTETKEPFELV